MPQILPPRIIFVWLNFLVAALLFTGIGWIQIQLGGTRPAHAYPGYLLVGCAGLLSVSAIGVKRSAPNWVSLLWTSLFFGYLLIRTWLSPLQFLANANLFLILAALTTYFLSAALLTELRWRLFFIGGFLLLEIGHLWVGIIQYVAGNNFLPFGYVRPDYGLRASGFYVCPNHFAGAWKFIRRMLRWLQQNEKAFSSSLALAVGASLGVVALMVHSFFDFNLQIPGNTLFIAFLFGILANPGVQWDKEQREPRSIALIWRLVPVLLGLVLIGFVWPRWPGEAESEAARLAFLKQSYALAIYHTLQAIQHGNEDPDTLYYLAESRRQLGTGFTSDTKRDFLTGAAKAFQQGLNYFPMDERLLVKGGLTLAQLGDFTGADDLFARAFEWSLNLGQVYAFYGSRLQLEGRNAEAAIAYRHSNQLSANQIATVGLNQTLEATKIARPTVSPTP